MPKVHILKCYMKTCSQIKLVHFACIQKVRLPGFFLKQVRIPFSDSICIELFEIESRFDTRKINYTEKIPVARCVIGGENLPVNSAQMVKFIVGNSTYDSDFIDGDHILKIIPTRHFDKESNLAACY